MEIILVILIVAVLNGAIAMIDGLLEGIVPLALHAENHMYNVSGVALINTLTDVMLGFGVSLIILKFIKKGFDTYVLWNGSDAEEEPYFLIINFIKALAVAITFPVIYGWMAIIVTDMTNQILNAIGAGTQYSWSAWVTGISSLGIVTAIFGLIFIITYFMLYFQFLMRGLEMLILRVGIPIACVGLLDNDSGVFKNYLATFFKSMLSVVVQIALAKLGVGLMLNMHVFWGVACMILALRTPRFLAEFVLPTSSGGGAGAINNVYHSVRLFGMAKMLVKR
ncbi:MAG: DUF6102 family protein [Defluviitaleaceae bacterium]|nr:DUF6102 family protein [Defluviitaleaceae bacterium]MCL2275175.1 DUF6102 family protein [Defluviitaleaceae bacterium]